MAPGARQIEAENGGGRWARWVGQYNGWGSSMVRWKAGTHRAPRTSSSRRTVDPVEPPAPEKWTWPIAPLTANAMVDRESQAPR